MPEKQPTEGMMMRLSDDDDVEGHKFKVKAIEDETDVEGHAFNYHGPTSRGE